MARSPPRRVRDHDADSSDADDAHDDAIDDAIDVSGRVSDDDRT